MTYPKLPAVHLITFVDRGGRWSLASARLARSARDAGRFSSVSAFDDSDLSIAFPDEMMRVQQLAASERRGFGLWAWKPLVAKLALAKFSDGDIVLYLDAGCTLNLGTSEARKRFDFYVETASREGFLFFQQELPEEKYTSPLVLQEFGNDQSICRTGQLLGGIWFLKVSSASREIVDEWWHLASKDNFRLIRGNDESANANNHRHDQSVISCLAKSRKLFSILDETYFSPDWELFGRRFPIWATRSRLPFSNGHRGTLLWRVVRLLERFI